jgi:hypothetical protein
MRNAEAVAALLPGVQWSMTNDDITTLKVPAGITPPTAAQVSAYIAAYSYRDLRQPLYPPLANLADALVHQAMGDGGVALQAYFTACEAVKTQYPKPS